MDLQVWAKTKTQLRTLKKETGRPFWIFKIQLHTYAASQTSLAST